MERTGGVTKLSGIVPKSSRACLMMVSLLSNFAQAACLKSGSRLAASVAVNADGHLSFALLYCQRLGAFGSAPIARAIDTTH